MSFEDYRRQEQASPIRREFYYGIVYAMAGGTRGHALIASNTTRVLGNQLEGRCLVFSSDLAVVTPGDNGCFYPDLSVECLDTTNRKEQSTRAPLLVVEVLSPSTRAYDSKEKLAEYKRIPALQHVLLIDSEAIAVTLHSRSDNGEWQENPTQAQGLDSSLFISGLGISVPLEALYRGVDFTA